MALFAKIDAASNGDNTIVAGVTGFKVRVLAYVLCVDTTMTVQWYSGAASGGTKLSGAMTLTAGTPLSSGPCPLSGGGQQLGHFETASGTLLNLSLGGAHQASGHLIYMLEPG